MMDKYIGRLLDNRYEILEVIGTGGMAVVYKARCHRLNRLVAIKILKDDYTQDGEFRRRFHAESQAVAMLNHPNIVSVYDVSTDGDADYIVMELVEGITLKQYMERRGGYLNWKESLHFAMQIAKALEHAHGQGIVHRDIKPHNVMILKNGSAKVTDFGIARIMSAQNTLTREALGSVHYISPEQAKGGRVDNRSDLYSLGVVMYEMLTGRPPYDGDSPVAVALQHINGGAAMPSTLNPNIPGGLEQIIMRSMSVDPAQRYASASAMLYDMDEFRKNPNILFYYGMPQQPRQPVQQPRTAAERAAAGRQAQPPRSPVQQPPRQPAQQPRQPVQQPRQPVRTKPEPEPEERSNKGLIIAISACAGVLLIGIIILIVLLSGGDETEKPERISVPSFVGLVYDDLRPRDYPDLILAEEGNRYEVNDTYAEGEIIDQDPEAREMVDAGTTVTFVISMGPQTDEMRDVLGKTKEDAKSALDSLKDLSLNIYFEEEHSSEVEKGKVIRTEPAAGGTLTKGQSVILWISKGPLTERMPDLTNKTREQAEEELKALENMNLIPAFKEETSKEIEEGKVTRTEPAKGETVEAGQTVTVYISSGSGILTTKVPQVVGMDIVKASSLLKDYNLKCEYDVVESDKPKDQVLTQSIDKGEEVDEGTVVNLTVSAGPRETKPTEPEPVSKTVVLKLPDNIAVSYKIQVYEKGAPCVEEYEVLPGDTEVPVSLKGTGVQYFDFYVNGTCVDTFKVDFSKDSSETIILNFTVSE